MNAELRSFAWVAAAIAAVPRLDVDIVDAPKLTNLDALSGFVSFGDLWFVRATALTSLRALARVASIESLALREMHGVTTLAELTALSELDLCPCELDLRDRCREDCGMR